MRLVGLFLVGIVVLACKDTDGNRAKPPQASGNATAPQVSTPEAAAAAPERPVLEPAPDEDAAWAEATAAAIRAVAPELGDIACRGSECTATLVADSESELVQLAETLQADDSLRSTGATNILLSAPAQAGGKLSMKIAVRYER